MLYKGHLVIVDIFLRNRPNHGQTLIEKHYIADTFLADICYSEHFFWAPGEHFRQNLPLNSGHPMIGWEKRRHMDVFVWQISLLWHEAHYLIFPSYFHPCYNSWASTKKIVYLYFESQSKTKIDSLFSHLSMNVMICKHKSFGKHFTPV